jgi:hypothetical protein
MTGEHMAVPGVRAIDTKKTGMTSKEVKEFLGWIHTPASNAKSYLLGTLHSIGKKHLQEYLDEFCYRFNHRN